MGKRGTESAGLHVFMTNGYGAEDYKPTILKDSTIHDCIGMCINIF